MTETSGFRILAICSGNVCRSPLVELLLRHRLADRPDFVIEGAGMIARPGDQMTVEMIRVAGRYGVGERDACDHRARRLDVATVARADLVLGLARDHRAKAVQMQPSAVRRAFTLTEFARLVEGAARERTTEFTPAELVAEATARRGLDPQRDRNRDDIEDPIGLPQAVYDEVGRKIAGAVDTIAYALGRTRAGESGRGPGEPSSGGPSLTFSFRPV
ncbi:low molecular weight phosphatase family protein [Gryllotalpicola protaetiae]|uniref:Low molecular weight phosphatase family protein n=1 Tax=Gryllotalpicola protaetiae TaxID=2419771 RepID=A0A387BJA2_9MICO|nr:low molecular weight phosphatase family protein [Gryllotalpicola protaetiae]AYG04175.1 low molecular weight phosphatase family protein [Gryllotalpicola protaetiae]